MADQLDLFDVSGRPAAPSDASPSAGEARAAASELHDGKAEESEKEMLRQRLGARLGVPITRLVFTRNRSRMLSARPEGDDGLYVRLHRAFANADEPTLDAVAVLCRRQTPRRLRKEALAVARAHFRRHAADRPPASVPELRSAGKTIDLGELRDRVNAEYFAGELEVEITWGRRSSARPRHTRRRRGGIHIRLGSYDDRHRLVRIHPVLDRPEVPEYVVESIVHHEMLHAAVPPVPGRKRRRVHTREFRRRERQFRRHREAEEWIESHLDALDRWRREG